MRQLGRAALFLLALGFLVGPTLAQTPARGYLGIMPTAAPGMAGMVLGQIDPDGPAAKAGLKAGDRVTQLDDKVVKDVEAFMELMQDKKPGDKVAFTVTRDGQEQKIEVTLGERRAQPPGNRPGPGAVAGERRPYLGITMQELTPPLRERLQVNVDKGVLVAEVTPDSPAAKAGLRQGDVITHLGDKAIADPAELAEVIQQTGTGKEVTLKFVRAKEAKEAKATLEDRPARLPRLPEVVPPVLDRLRPREGDVQALQKRVEDLEKRLAELEKKVNKP